LSHLGGASYYPPYLAVTSIQNQSITILKLESNGSLTRHRVIGGLNSPDDDIYLRQHPEFTHSSSSSPSSSSSSSSSFISTSLSSSTYSPSMTPSLPLNPELSSLYNNRNLHSYINDRNSIRSRHQQSQIVPSPLNQQERGLHRDMLSNSVASLEIDEGNRGMITGIRQRLLAWLWKAASQAGTR